VDILPVVDGGDGLPLMTMAMGFLGGLALFLHGMDRVARGLQGLTGTSLSRILARVSTNRFTGVATGILVTATIQSSTVTMVLVIGFLSAGLLGLVPSIGVILGANVGTTITAQIIAFDVVGSALWMVAAGVFVRFAVRRDTIRMAATAVAGLGILFLGMGVMQSGMAPLRDYEPFLSLMATERGPLPGLLIGAGLTALVQSSSATIGIVIVMATQGLVPLETGIAISLGASLGTAATTMIATIGRPRVALRAGLVHVLFNVVGVAVILVLLDPLAELARLLSPTAAGLTGSERAAAETPRQIANAYTLAKSAMLLGFLPFTHQLARLVERLVTVRDDEGRIAPRYLDESLIGAPGAALELAELEVGRLGRKTLDQVDRVLPALLQGSAVELSAIAEADEDVDALHDAIIDYLRRVDQGTLSDHERSRLHSLTSATSYLELVGDIVQHDLVRVGLRRIEEGVPLSEETRGLISDFHATMRRLLDEALGAYLDGDVARARGVLEAKPEVNALLEEAATQRALRLGADAPARVAAYTRGIEALEHLRRVYTFAKRIARLVPGVE